MISSPNWMVFPFSKAIVALLKGKVSGFGNPGAKEMSDSFDVVTTSAMINTEKKYLVSSSINPDSF